MIQRVPKVLFRDWRCEVFMSHYHSPYNHAIILTSNGEPIATASVNIVERVLPRNQIAIKTWSENEGMHIALRKAGIIGARLYDFPSGFVKIGVFQLLIENPHVLGDMVQVSE